MLLWMNIEEKCLELENNAVKRKVARVYITLKFFIVRNRKNNNKDIILLTCILSNLANFKCESNFYS